VKYLLDVNALVALGFRHHEFHGRVAAWVRAQQYPALATCSITELGFVRVLAQAPAYGLTVAQARTLLLCLKESSALAVTFIPDGHLAELANANGALLATLDERIPEAYLIRQGRIR
jgi:predicted nucleic acid-binding protein